MYLVNGALALATLGVYWFWGKAKIRRYLYAKTEFDGDRFQFHGTGLEMFVGFAKALLLVAALTGGAVALVFAAGRSSGGFKRETLEVLTALTIYAGVAVFVPLAIIGALRYRLSRTSWRGIRFSFHGRAAEFLWLCVRVFALTLATFGLYWPYAYMRLRKYIVSRVRFGTQPFSFTGRGSDLFGAFVISLLLFLPTLGIYRFWYNARVDRYAWENTLLGPMRFESRVTGGGLLGLQLGNLVLLFLTLGIAAPWVTIRTLQYRLDTLVAHGSLDYAAILQQMQTATATGEGLADTFDLNLDIGV